MNCRQFVEHCEYVMDLNPEWRRGQTYFNELVWLNPALADFVRGKECDPFYRDSAIPEFLDLIRAYAEVFGSVTDERRSNI